MKEKDKLPKEDLPSAADDCADVNSAYERYKKNLDKILDIYRIIGVFLVFS